MEVNGGKLAHTDLSLEVNGGQWRWDADASPTVERLQLHGLSAVVSLAALDHQTHSQL